MQILQPTYIKEFQCIGSSCEDSCCIGWKVTVDEESYKKYKKVSNIKIKKKLNNYISRERSVSSKQQFAKIKLDKESRCHFLTEENLCEIHKELGEQFLCQTCKNYPKIYNQVDKYIEIAGTLSCPELARLALLNKEPIAFDIIESSQEIASYFHQQMDSTKLHSLDFFSVRAFIIEILQTRTVGLDERMIFLGLFLQGLEKEKDPMSSINKYRHYLQTNSLNDMMQSIPVNEQIQLQIIKELIDFRFSIGIINKRYLNCLKETLDGLGVSKNTTNEEILINYKKCITQKYYFWKKENEYILENYLVHKVFEKTFPTNNTNAFEEYITIVILYAMIKLHIIGMLNYHEEWSDDLTITCIQSISRVIDHSSVYLKNINKILEKNNFNSMAYMSIFIKN